jgi:hypothetical protein
MRNVTGAFFNSKAETVAQIRAIQPLQRGALFYRVKEFETFLPPADDARESNTLIGLGRSGWDGEFESPLLQRRVC